MAYYQNSEDEDQNVQGMNQQPNAQGQGNAPQLSSGNSAPMASSGPIATGAAAPAAPKATSSGMSSFQNIQKANQGIATDKLNTAAGNLVSNQAQKANTGINQATTSFGQKVETGTLANRGQALQDVKDVVQQARNVTTDNSQIAQPQQTRFQEVINSKYQGPQSLRQSGDYQNASGDVSKAQTMLGQAQNSQGREELLKNLFAKSGSYTQGLNKLDAGILNASQSGVQNLQNIAKAQGNVQNKLDEAQIASANLAQNRTQEIADIRDQSRTAFSEGKSAEEAATDARLASVVKDWDKLPEYFRELIRNKEANNAAAKDSMFQSLTAAQNDPNTSPEQKLAINKQLADLGSRFNPNAVTLNSAEAGILGVGAGEGLYNMGTDAIKTAIADKERLISKDEQLRQSVLSQLAGLDQSQILDRGLRYSNAEKAGTQDALDALDTAGLRSALNEAEGDFQTYAEGANITGSGSKKNKSSGKRYYASQSANIGDLLKKSGYQFDDIGADTPVADQQLLRNLGNVVSSDVTADPKGISGALAGATDPLTNMGDGQSLAQNYLDYVGMGTGINAVTGALGLGSLGTSLGGLFGASSSKASKNKAKQIAFKDLQNKVNSALDSQGFENRFNVSNDAKTNERVASLQALLASLDKTNS